MKPNYLIPLLCSVSVFIDCRSDYFLKFKNQASTHHFFGAQELCVVLYDIGDDGLAYVDKILFRLGKCAISPLPRPFFRLLLATLRFPNVSRPSILWVCFVS